MLAIFCRSRVYHGDVPRPAICRERIHHASWHSTWGRVTFPTCGTGSNHSPTGLMVLRHVAMKDAESILVIGNKQLDAHIPSRRGFATSFAAKSTDRKHSFGATSHLADSCASARIPLAGSCARDLTCATRAVQCTSKYHATELLGASSWPMKYAAPRSSKALFFR